VPQTGQVRDGRRGAARVVDADHRHARQHRLVHDDHRPAALHGGGHRGVPVGQRLQDPRVDGGVADVLQVAVHRAGGVQQQPDAVLLEAAGQAVEELHRGRVGEGVGQPLVDEHPHGADPAAAQTPGHRVGPGEAELQRAGQDPLAQRRGELVGPVVRVGHGRPRDPEVLGQCEQRHPPGRRFGVLVLRHVLTDSVDWFL